MAQMALVEAGGRVYHALQELYEKLWRREIDMPRSPLLANAVATDRPDDAVDHLVEAMTRLKTVSVPASTIDRFPISRTYLHGQGTTQAAGRRLRFLHHTFFDYVYA